MKRLTQFFLACAIVLTVVSFAAAQARPVPVTRLGDWVEVGPEVFMNIIASNNIRYRTTHNYDFEDDIQDTPYTGSVSSSLAHFGPCDCLINEARLGVDFRYKKNLRMRVLLEAESLFDGNVIDDRANLTDGTENPFHTERFWIRYTFPGTPIQMTVGAPLWFHDAAGLVADDDPGIFFRARLGPQKEWEVKVAAIIQQEAFRLGLTNDNDNVYYLGTIAYSRKPHRFALDMWYQRDRFNGPRAGTAQNQKVDIFWLAPNWTGSFGPLSGLLEFVVQVGSAEGSDGTEFDVFSFGFIGQLEANLGIVRPVIGIIFGQGDDTPGDTDLEGFTNLSHQDIGLTGFVRQFNIFNGPTINDWGPSPARAGVAGIGFHTVYNALQTRVGNAVCGPTAGIINTAACNAGTLLIPVGLKIFPVKGHQVNLWYIYVANVEGAVLEAATGLADVDPLLYHELGVQWNWTLNRHFSIRARGIIAIPDQGSKDIASTVVCDPATGRACQGEDPLLLGEIGFRGRF